MAKGKPAPKSAPKKPAPKSPKPYNALKSKKGMKRMYDGSGNGGT